MELGNLFILLLTTAIVSGSGVCSVRGDGTVEEIIQKGNQLLQSAVKEVTDAFKFSCPDDTKPLLLTCTGPEVVRSGMVEKVANCGYGKKFPSSKIQNHSSIVGSFNSEWPKYCCSDFLDFVSHHMTL